MNGKTSILIVDDDSATRKLIEKYLVATDFELEFADTLKGALNILKTFRPDIAVIDYFLPDGDGGEFCETVRTHADRSINSMHILGITARKDEKLETRMLNKGADDFILKPFSRDDFIAKVNVGKRISGKGMSGAQVVGAGNRLGVRESIPTDNSLLPSVVGPSDWRQVDGTPT